MHPRICVNGICSWSWTLHQDLAFYREEGITRANIPLFKFADDVPAGVDAIKRSGVQVVSLAGGGAQLLGGRAVAELKPLIDAAAELGSPMVYGVSGGAPPEMSTDEAYGALVKDLPAAIAYAREKGVILALENNSISTRSHGFIHAFADVADLARDTGVGICLELQNSWYERDFERLCRENASRISIVQVSDFQVGEDLRMNRRVPGDGSMPLAWMIETLLAAGYGGLFDIEVVGPSIESEGYASAIRRSVEWMSRQLTTLGA